MRRFFLLLLLVAWSFGLGAAEKSSSPDKPPFEISKWDYVRVRKGRSGAGNVVTLSFMLKNLTGLSLQRLDCRIELREAMGAKVGEMKPKTIRYLKPDEEIKVTVTKEWVPIFGTYFLNFKYRVGRDKLEASYLGMSPFDRPMFAPPKPEGRNIRLFVMGYEFHSNPKTRDGILAVRLKNFGGLPARRPRLRLRLYSQNRRLLGHIDTHLRSPKLPKDKIEEIPPGKERTYRLVLFRVPPYDMYDVFVSHDQPRPEEALPGDEFTGAKEIEVVVTGAKVKGRSLVLTCRARNGLEKAIAALALDFWLVRHETVKDSEGRETLEKKTVKVRTAKVETGLSFESGEEKDFTFKMLVPPERFDDYGYQLGYEEPGSEVVTAGKGGKDARKLGEVSFEVTGGEILQTGGVRLKGVVRQKGGDADVEVSVWFIFTDDKNNEIARRELKIMVATDGQQPFDIKFEDVPAFAAYHVEMGELAPKE